MHYVYEGFTKAHEFVVKCRAPRNLGNYNRDSTVLRFFEVCTRTLPFLLKGTYCRIGIPNYSNKNSSRAKVFFPFPRLGRFPLFDIFGSVEMVSSW